MSIRDWIVDEYEQRIRNGKSSPEAVREIKSLIEEFDRVNEAWHEAGELLVSHVATDGLRTRRQALARAPVIVTSAPSVPTRPAASIPDQSQPTFGEPRYEVATLVRSIFDALIPVGASMMRYGDMKREDWEIKSQQYRTLADNSTTRHWACDRILKRVIGDLTTEEVFSEAEFQQLIPEIGF